MKNLIIFFICILFIGCEILKRENDETNGTASTDSKNSSSEGTIRNFKTNELVTYLCTADFKGDLEGYSGTVNLTMSIQDGIKNNSGKDCNEFLTIMEFSIPEIEYEETFRSSIYYHQDSSGNLYKCGSKLEDTGELMPITSGENGIHITMESPMSIGNTLNELYRYENGSWRDCTDIVKNKSLVTVGLEKKEAYLLQSYCKDQDGEDSTYDEYYIPSVYGIFPVLVEGSEETFDMECRAENFSLK